jgi:hypothetical protein
LRVRPNVVPTSGNLYVFVRTSAASAASLEQRAAEEREVVDARHLAGGVEAARVAHHRVARPERVRGGRHEPAASAVAAGQLASAFAVSLPLP